MPLLFYDSVPLDQLHAVPLVFSCVLHCFIEKTWEHFLDDVTYQRKPLEAVCQSTHLKTFDDDGHPGIFATYSLSVNISL